jgi:lysophospholipase L1-like esterase
MVGFAGLIAAVPLLQVAIEVGRGDPPGVLDLFDWKPTATNLRTFERGLEDASVVARWLRPSIQYGQFAWLLDGGEKVLLGRDGWLFYKPGVDQMVGPAWGEHGNAQEMTNDPLPAIVAFRDALAARGIHLIVMPAPNKESVYPDRLTRRAKTVTGLRSASIQNLFERLKAANVPTIDLFQVFAEARQAAASTNTPPLYLVQDTHWSPAGVSLAARAAARSLLAEGWARLGAMDYQEKPSAVTRLGDLLKMMRVSRIERGAVPEQVAAVQVVHSSPPQAYRDDPRSEVLVLGDSFLRIYEQDAPGSAGFVAHLAKELKQPVASLVNDGGASTLVRQELHHRPALLANKKVVLWEFVERDIRWGTEGWQIVPLPAAAAQDSPTRAVPDRPVPAGAAAAPSREPRTEAQAGSRQTPMTTNPSP